MHRHVYEKCGIPVESCCILVKLNCGQLLMKRQHCAARRGVARRVVARLWKVWRGVKGARGFLVAGKARSGETSRGGARQDATRRGEPTRAKSSLVDSARRSGEPVTVSVYAYAWGRRSRGGCWYFVRPERMREALRQSREPSHTRDSLAYRGNLPFPCRGMPVAALYETLPHGLRLIVYGLRQCHTVTCTIRTASYSHSQWKSHRTRHRKRSLASQLFDKEFRRKWVFNL